MPDTEDRVNLCFKPVASCWFNSQFSWPFPGNQTKSSGRRVLIPSTLGSQRQFCFDFLFPKWSLKITQGSFAILLCHNNTKALLKTHSILKTIYKHTQNLGECEERKCESITSAHLSSHKLADDTKLQDVNRFSKDYSTCQWHNWHGKTLFCHFWEKYKMRGYFKPLHTMLRCVLGNTKMFLLFTLHPIMAGHI